ncbi:MAG: glycosyltransferase family 2 protein [Crenarchaeota archaeon]|nr:MAG: glycosyltransferase family 2 protein [Thermoproteota archaeon]
MPKISLMIHTASFDDFLKNQGINSYFESLIDNLERQTFKDFEFIYIDTFYEDNKDRFASYPSSFCVKHVPVHPNHRYWYDLGYVYISAAKNTGILYADGELLVTCDDAEFFPDNLLEKYWKYYEIGHLLHAHHKRMTRINTHDGKLTFPIEGDIYVNDHRFNHVKNGGYYPHKHGTWLFAGTSFPLAEALLLNGFNERMDGCKSLEDCEFGTRLALTGLKFLLDHDGYIYILDHQSYGNETATFGPDGPATSPKPHETKKKDIKNLIAIENHGFCCCANELREIKANAKPLTEKHWEIIQRETLKYRNFDPLAPENKENLDIWTKTPTFDLKKERKALRNSPDWKW